jgi:hypothetical protein
MRISNVVQITKAVIKKEADARPSYAVVKAIDGKRVDILVGHSKTTIKNVYVVGDVNSLTTGQRVQISWWDNRRPVVVAGGGSGDITISGTSITGMDAATLGGHDVNYFLSRSNHVGTQSPSTISPQGHNSSLDADMLDGQHGSYYVPITRQVIAGSGLAGGGALSANVTLSVAFSGNPTTIQPDDTPIAGSSIYPAHTDHRHAIATDAAGNIQAGDTAAEGVSTSFARADHRHGVATAAPLANSVNLGNSYEGFATTLARSDHTHQLDQAITPVWTGSHTFQGLTTTRHIVPELTDTYDLGTSLKLWRKGWLSELDTILFAKNTITLLGGWFMVSKGEGSLPADVPAQAANTTIDLGPGADAFAVNDFILFRGSLAMEYMQLVSYVGGTTWVCARDLDGSGPNAWVAGSVYVNLGYNGTGRIELNAYDTPRISLVTQGATYNAQGEAIRIGDLNANWGYVSQVYGIAVGSYSNGIANFTWDNTNGIRIRSYQTVIAQWANNGTITLGSTATGQPNTVLSSASISLRSGTTERIKLNADTSGFIGSHITWDTNGNVSISGANLTITNGAFTLKTAASGARFELTSAGIAAYNSSGVQRAKIGNDGSGWFGASGAFSWDTAGNIVAASGTIGGWTISSTKISSTGVDITSGASAHIAFGTTPPSSPSSGTGIYIDKTGFYGLASNTPQIRISSTDGRLYAGADKVLLDASGLSLTYGNSTYNKVSWYDPTFATEYASIYTMYQGIAGQALFAIDIGGVRQFQIDSYAARAKLATGLAIGNIDDTGMSSGEIRTGFITYYYGATKIGDIGGTDTSWLKINNTIAKNIYTPRMLRADGGLVAGATSASAGQIVSTAEIKAGTGLYSRGYSGGIFVPYTGSAKYLYDSGGNAWGGGNKNTGTYTFNLTDANNGLPSDINGIVVRATATWTAVSAQSYLLFYNNTSQGAIGVLRVQVANQPTDDTITIPVSDNTFQIVVNNATANSATLVLAGYFL